MKRFFCQAISLVVMGAILTGWAGCAQTSTLASLWNEILTPQPGKPGMVIDNNLLASGPLAQSSDGKSLFSYARTNAPARMIIKSTNDGHTWAQSGAAWQTAIDVVAIACSPSESSVVYYTTAATVYKSVDAGATFATLANIPPGNAITCLSVAQLAGRYIVLAGTSGNPGNVYYLDESLGFYTFTLLGTNSFAAAVATAGGGSVTSILAVALSPSFAIDRTVAAIGTDGARTYLLVDVTGGAWGATIGRATSIAGAANSAAIAYPNDFSLASPNFYFGIGGSGTAASNGVYRFFGLPAPAASVTNILSPTSGAGWPASVISLDVVGSLTGASILAGTAGSSVIRSNDAGATWANTVTKQPTASGSQPVFVSFRKGSASTAYALVAASGLSDESAFNLSHSGGQKWNQVALINSTEQVHNFGAPAGTDLLLAANAGPTDYIWRFFGGYWERVWQATGTIINMLQASPNYTSDGAVFYASYNSAAAIMRSTDFGDTFLAQASAPGSTIGTPDVVHSLAVVDANTVLVGSTGGIVTRTTNNGFLWSEAATDLGDVTSLRRASNGDIIAGGVSGPDLARVGRSGNGGASFVTTPVPVFGAISFIYTAPAADYPTSGVVYVSNRLFSSVSSGVYWGTIPASSATASVWTRADADPAWYQSVGIMPHSPYGPVPDSGLVTAPGGPGLDAEGTGMVYTAGVRRVGSFATPDGPALGRIRGRTTMGDASRAEVIPGPVAEGSQVYPLGLWLAPGASAGGVTLYTLGVKSSADPVVRLYSYSDNFNRAATGITVSNIGTDRNCVPCPAAGTASATVKWSAFNGSTGYLAIISATQYTSFHQAVSDVAAGATPLPYMAASITSGTSWNVTGLPGNAVLYLSVWAFQYTGAGTLTGTTSQAQATALLDAAVPNFPLAISSFGVGTSFVTPPLAPTGLLPGPAAMNQPMMPVFQWDAVPDATSYRLQIAYGADFSRPLIDIAVNGTFYAYSGAPLFNSNAYFWRVAAVTASGISAYTVNAFTTMASPPGTAPVTVTVPAQAPPFVSLTVPIPTVSVPAITLPPITVKYPTPVVTRPAAATVTQQPVINLPLAETPGYVWVAAVAVGTILVLALIVLIIRTRR